MAPFTYQPLDLGGIAVRLLRLIKGNATNNIQCELFEGWINPLEDGIPYEALSYTWGSTDKEASITVNGSTLPITLNLYIALQHLRSENEDRILWIDAICIDQDCEQERNHQVRHMGDIYKQAEQVIIWLGEGTKETVLIMDTMKRLQENTVHVMGNWRKSALLWMHDHAGMGDIRAHQYKLQSGMKLLLSRPWFQRVWILQEIANARVAIILCGSKTVSARIFAQVPALIELTPDPHCQAVLDIMPGLSRHESWWGQDRKLHTLLRKFRESKATDGRDIVFALLGISSDANELLLPDYNKPLRQVIHETTSFLLFEEDQDYPPLGFLDWTLPEFLHNLDSLGKAVLTGASESGPGEIVKLLLESGQVEIDARDTLSRTPLSWAAQRGNAAVVTLLLDQGAIVNSEDMHGRTPLLYAFENEHIDVVKLLLEHGALLGSYDDEAPLIGKTSGSSKGSSDDRDYPKNFEAIQLGEYNKRPDNHVIDPGNVLVSNTSFQDRSGLQSGRLFGEFQGETVIVERVTVPLDRSSSAASTLQTASRIFESFSKSATDEEYRFLQYKACLTEHPTARESLGIVYNFPDFADDSCDAVTLETLLYSSGPIPPLRQRFMVAQMLSTTILRLHSNLYLHKFIRPLNILFFTPKATTIDENQSQNPDFERPFVSGFKLLTSITDRNPDLVVREYEELLWQHPQQRRQTRGTTYPFRQEYDIFSFGCLLFNLAMWEPVSSPSFSWAPLEEVAKARREILDARVGKIYVDAMFWCLGLESGSPILSSAQSPLTRDGIVSLTNGFYDNVVMKLSQFLA